MTRLSADALVTALKAAAEPTRLRILVLLAGGELSVKDLTGILGQSQPRISRHLKLLTEAELIDRAPEGSWVYFRLAEALARQGLVGHLMASLDPDDAVLVRDRARAVRVKRDRETAAQAYFKKQAANWDRIRALHIAESDVEAAVLRALGPGPIDLLVDLGTGTGRMLTLSADRYRRGIGFDVNPAMLSYARTRLDTEGIAHVQIRQGDIYNLPLADAGAGAVIMHQVLHFLSDPARAVAEAARILKPGGRIVIVDFAPHEMDFLREVHAHQRLGFAQPVVAQWLADAGLSPLETRFLEPGPGSGAEKLTVCLWVAERPVVAPALVKTGRRKLERTV